jgi:CHASE3 domain sensor protein
MTQVTDQKASSTTTQTTTPPTDDRIQTLLENADVQVVAQQTEIEERIQQQFEHKSEKVRSKLGSA